MHAPILSVQHTGPGAVVVVVLAAVVVVVLLLAVEQVEQHKRAPSPWTTHTVSAPHSESAVQLDAVQLWPSTHTSPDPTWPHEVPPATTHTPAPHVPQPAHSPPQGLGNVVVVVVLSKQDSGVHAQPDVQHAVWPLPSEKQAAPPAQSASDEHGNGNWQVELSTHSRALSG